MKFSRKSAAAAALCLAGMMLTGCGKNESETRSGDSGAMTDNTAAMTDSSSDSGMTDGEMTGDVDGDGFIDDVVTGAEDIVDDVVTGAEDIVDDMIPGDGGNAANGNDGMSGNMNS